MHGRETMPCAALSGRERVGAEMLGRYLEAGSAGYAENEATGEFFEIERK